MKKLFWLILTLCLLVVPAMAEEECDHPYGECTGKGTGECWECGAEGVIITGEIAHNINGNWQHNDTHHWGSCACGEYSVNEVHIGNCNSDRCWGCGESGVTIGDPQCNPGNIAYEYDATAHWGVCGNCGTTHDKEQHTVPCVETECIACGMTATTATPLYHVDVYEDYDCDDTHHWYSCGACGEKLDKEEHDFRNWEVVDEATCTEKGKERSICFVCGIGSKDRDIEPLGHEGGEMEVTKEATCTEAGEKAGKCTRCGEEGETAVIPALGHDEVWETTKEATCLEAGEQTGTCARCEADLGTKPVETLGHDEGEWVVVKEATREEEGLKELQCTRCGEVLDSEVIPVVTIVWYSENTACLAGTEFRALANVDTNKWYTFVELDLSQDGVQTFDLIASNMYRIGTVTVTVFEGTVTVDYDLCTDEIIVQDEFMTLFTSLEDVTTVDQSAFTEYTFGEAINIQESLNGTTAYLYLCNIVTYHTDMYRIVRVW